MAVIQTPQGRVIGLILPKEEQPKPQPQIEKPAEVRTEKNATTPPKPAARRPGRPPRK